MKKTKGKGAHTLEMGDYNKVDSTRFNKQFVSLPFDPPGHGKSIKGPLPGHISGQPVFANNSPMVGDKPLDTRNYGWQSGPMQSGFRKSNKRK